MNIKRLTAVAGLLLMMAISSMAQPTYTFSISSHSVTEGNVLAVAGYVRADVAPVTDDSVQVIFRSGDMSTTHIDVPIRTVIYFAAGTDSMPFYVQLHDDTFVERPELAVYAIRNNNTNAIIGSDSILYLNVLDNDLMATISWVTDTASAYIEDGTATVCETIYNPNPFYVRFFTRTYDCWFPTPLMTLDACGAVNYFYDWDTIYAPPGTSSMCQPITILNDTAVLPDKHLLIMLQSVDPTNIIDSVLLFTIRNGNAYQAPSVSFDTNNATIIKDSAVLIGIPITVVNPNHLPFTYMVDTVDFTSSSTFKNNIQSRIRFQDNFFTPPVRSVSHDTLWLQLYDTGLIDDTSTTHLAIKRVQQNLSIDTFFTLTIIDTGSLFISFKGAGMAHLKTDTVGYVQVFTSAPVKYDITAYISYLNGNAVMGTDFLWLDTTVTFPANAFDTVSLPVYMLKNGIHDGNKQVNLRLSNVSPANTVYDIIQYTYTIIDNDSMAIWPTGVISTSNTEDVKVYPNPFGNAINIRSALSNYDVSITNMLGEKVREVHAQSGDTQITLSEIPAGSYLIRIADSSKSYVKLITKM